MSNDLFIVRKVLLDSEHKLYTERMHLCFEISTKDDLKSKSLMSHIWKDI